MFSLPPVTRALIAVNALVFLAENPLGASPGGLVGGFLMMRSRKAWR